MSARMKAAGSPEPLALRLDQPPELGHVLGRGPRRADPHHAELEEPARLLQVLEVLRRRRQQHPRHRVALPQHRVRRQLVHPAALAVRDGDEPHRLQRLQRLAHRRAADAVAVHQRVLGGQRLARADLAARGSGPASAPAPGRTACAGRSCRASPSWVARERSAIPGRSVLTVTAASYATRCTSNGASVRVPPSSHGGAPGVRLQRSVRVPLARRASPAPRSAAAGTAGLPAPRPPASRARSRTTSPTGRRRAVGVEEAARPGEGRRHPDRDAGRRDRGGVAGGPGGGEAAALAGVVVGHRRCARRAGWAWCAPRRGSAASRSSRARCGRRAAPMIARVERVMCGSASSVSITLSSSAACTIGLVAWVTKSRRLDRRALAVQLGEVAEHPAAERQARKGRTRRGVDFLERRAGRPGAAPAASTCGRRTGQTATRRELQARVCRRPAATAASSAPRSPSPTTTHSRS